MMEAHIVSPRGTLYYASSTSAYDLEAIRQHLRDAVPEAFPGDVELAIVLDDPADEACVATWLRYIARTGVRTRLSIVGHESAWMADGEPNEPVASVA